MKRRFLNELNKVEREGVDKLVKWLERSDFFTAPASTRFHGSYEGGLLEHSLAVYDQLRRDPDAVKYPDDTLRICGLLHDICKTDFYEVSTRNTKDEHGKWIQVPFYTVNDKFPLGHGEKSIFILQKFIDLEEEEVMAIRWHMAGFEPKENYMSMGVAYSLYPLCTILSCADLKATYLLKK